MGESARTVTMLLRDWRAGDQAALDELMPLVYAELHKLASSYMRAERPGHTWRPTDLVGEAYLRLADGTTPALNDRVHFFGIAARTMRQILVDHARKHASEKRGAGDKPVTFDEAVVGGASGRTEDLLALDTALSALAKFDERKARVVELHYFGGMTQEEIAAALDVHVNTVARDLKLAEAWLHQQLRDA
jgi:RNA polymerase sigma factor (TIGR02999 family)